MLETLLMIKLVLLIAAFKIGQGGTHRRPWFLGLGLALVFSGFTFLMPHSWKELAFLIAAHCLICPAVFLLFWRVEAVIPTVLVAGVGVVGILFGIPLLLFLGELAKEMLLVSQQ